MKFGVFDHMDESGVPLDMAFAEAMQTTELIGQEVMPAFVE